jgi:hypothetical protein
VPLKRLQRRADKAWQLWRELVAENHRLNEALRADLRAVRRTMAERDQQKPALPA